VAGVPFQSWCVFWDTVVHKATDRPRVNSWGVIYLSRPLWHIAIHSRRRRIANQSDHRRTI